MMNFSMMNFSPPAVSRLTTEKRRIYFIYEIEFFFSVFFFVCHVSSAKIENHHLLQSILQNKRTLLTQSFLSHWETVPSKHSVYTE